MERYLFSELNAGRLRTCCQVRDRGLHPDLWRTLALPLTDDERRRAADVAAQLSQVAVSLLNEATVWARGIYPLLALAERYPFRAWAQVPMSAEIGHVRLEGVLDGAIGNCISGTLDLPYLVVLEAKRGLEGSDPRFALHGQLLAAAALNRQATGDEEQEIFGCYTIAQAWYFIRAQVTGLGSGIPTLVLDTSREYVEVPDVEAIAGVLKGIVARGAAKLSEAADALGSSLEPTAFGHL